MWRTRFATAHLNIDTSKSKSKPPATRPERLLFLLNPRLRPFPILFSTGNKAMNSSGGLCRPVRKHEKYSFQTVFRGGNKRNLEQRIIIKSSAEQRFRKL